MNDTTEIIKTTETLEREKYERVWTMPGYRRISPAERIIAGLWEKWGEPRGTFITDFGCGTGRAVQWLRAGGAFAMGIDFADNCLDPGVDIPFENHCLWEDFITRAADYSLCVDVMEHIPEQHVKAVLTNIAKLTKLKGYFQIAHQKDLGIWGEPLHLTIKPREDWTGILEECGWEIKEEVAIGTYATGYHVVPLVKVEKPC